MTRKLRLLHDYVLVREIKGPEKTEGGIYFPEVALRLPSKGVVVQKGPGSRNDDDELVAVEFEPGDEVLFGKYSGEPIMHNGEELLLLKASLIVAKMLQSSKSA